MISLWNQNILGGSLLIYLPQQKRDFDLESGDREPHPECKNIKFLYLSINFLTPNSFHHSSILHLRTCRGVTEHQGANQLVTVKSSQQILDCFVIVMSE